MSRPRVFIAACCLFLATAAQASVSPDSVAYRLKELHVTGIRTNSNPLRVPLAVGVADSRDFANSRRFGLDDALGLMPGVQTQSRYGAADMRLTIRGFGARASGDKSNSATIRGIKVLVDGFPETDPDGRSALDLVDLAAASHIEVVRSNASTLFGNASGGLINIETHSPDAGNFLGTDNIFGGFGYRKNSVSANTAVGTGSFSATASNMNYDGWRDHSGSKSTQLSTVLTSNFDASNHLKLALAAVTDEFHVPGALTQAEFDADPTAANATYKSRDERRYNREGRLGAEFTHDFSPRGTLQVMSWVTPKILQRSERGSFRDFGRYHVGGGATYRWREHEDGTGTQFLAGADEAYLDGSIMFYSLTADGNRGDHLKVSKREGAEAAGVFLQAETDLTPELRATVGGRFDHQRYLFEQYPGSDDGLTVHQKMFLGHVTPKAALLYKASDSQSWYVNVGGGIESPAFNEVDPPPSAPAADNLNPFMKPMTSLTVELGTKGSILPAADGALRSVAYSVAAYRIGITDEIVPYDGGGYFFSAGKSRRFGVEVGGDAGFKGGVHFLTAVTWMDAKYDEYTNDLGNFAGNKVPGVASLILNARLRFEPQPGCMAEVGVQHLGSYFADDANKLEVPSFLVLNAGAGYRLTLSSVELEARAGVSNLTDKKYAGSAFVNPASSAYLEPGLPRNGYIGASIKFLP